MRRFALNHLVYELTEACNQNCRFCYNHWRPGGSRPADPRLAKRTLRRLLKQADVGSISFSGGEPMLLGNIHDLALRCRFKGTSVNILTNGTLLSEDAIINFKNIGTSVIQIPLLSYDPTVHDYLTGLPGSWGKALDSIRKVLRILGPDHFAAVLIITAKNAGDIPGTMELYRKLGIETVMVNRFNIGGNGLMNREELSLSGDSLNSAFKLVSDFSLANPGMSFVSGVCTPVCVMDPLHFPGIRFTSCSTEIKDRPITVSGGGDVRFCNHSPFVLGNIWEKSIEEILSDPLVASRYAAVPEACAGCRLFSRCKGGCRAASEQVYGSFGVIDPIAGPVNGGRP